MGIAARLFIEFLAKTAPFSEMAPRHVPDALVSLTILFAENNPGEMEITAMLANMVA